MNLPNRLTIIRLLISIIYFVILTYIQKDGTFDTHLIDVSLGLFIIAVITDFLDGYLARRYQMVTNFGRIADPFVDKVLVCGSFVFFVSWPQMHDFMPAWMLVVILGREFIISAIRAFAEARNIPFGSSLWGQHKMTIQCITIIWGFIYLGHFTGPQYRWAAVSLRAFIWLMLISTIISGFSYLLRYRSVHQDS